jgi:esterase
MTLLNYKLFLPEVAAAQKKTPLIILHGLLGAMDNWRSQAKKLSVSRPVYTLDLRNHGSSPHLKGMSYREMYEDVLQLASHESLDSFHLLGHSMGGKVAMQLALAKPSLVKSLTVVDIAPKPYPLWHQKTLQGVLSAPLDDLHTRQEIDNYLKPWIEDPAERTFMLKNLKRKEDTKGFIWRCNLSEISKGYLKIAGFTTALATYPKKCLFIKGDLSNYVQESDTTLIQSLFPDAKIVGLKNSGHLPHFQEPDAFFDSLSQFLET